MDAFIQHGPIRCGDHYLKAKVTFTEYRHEKYVDGVPLVLTQEPEVTIKRLICERESVARQLIVDTKMIERTFS